jgi:hypothetical protein
MIMRTLAAASCFGALILVWAGCASTATGGARGGTEPITRAEIEEAALGVTDAYDLVLRLRPSWLQRRTPRSIADEPPPVMVYVDQQRMGGMDELSLIQISDIVEVRYLDSAQAQRLPGIGPGHVEGAIVVVTGRSP